MSNNKVHLLHLSLYNFFTSITGIYDWRGNVITTTIIKNSRDMFSKNVIKTKITQLRFSKIRSGNFSLTGKSLIG